MTGHRCTGVDCPACDATIGRIEWHRDAPADPGEAERAIRREEARLEARVYGEDRWF